MKRRPAFRTYEWANMSTCVGQICGENRLGAMDIFVVVDNNVKTLKIAKGKGSSWKVCTHFFFLFLKAPSFGLHSERLSAALSCTWLCCILLKPWTLTSLYNFRVQMELHSYLAAKTTLLCILCEQPIVASVLHCWQPFERHGYKLFKRCIIYTIHHLCIVNMLIQAETLLTSSQWAQSNDMPKCTVLLA